MCEGLGQGWKLRSITRSGFMGRAHGIAVLAMHGRHTGRDDWH